MNPTTSEQIDLAERTVRETLGLGADEVSVSVSQGSHTTVQRRDGKVEQATEATTRGLSLSLMVDDRYSSHGTSDLRPEALTQFLKNAIAATRFLEPDPDRALPDPALCGRGSTDAELDVFDPAFNDYTPADRSKTGQEIEAAVVASGLDNVISSSAYIADGSSKSARVTSTGFAEETHGAWFALGGETTLATPDGKRPEASAYYAGRYLSDLPSIETIQAEIVRRANERLNSGPIESGKYPMILLNQVAGRILGVIGGPLSGGSLHHDRSCLKGKLGESIGSKLFTIVDDPTIPRGLGSRAWDGDTLIAKPRTIVKNGVLESYYLNTYYGRKLDMAPTTGGRSNWVIPGGDQSWQEIAKAFPKAILVTGFLGGNSNGVTGNFSFGVRGVLLENGVPTKNLSEMNVAGGVLDIFHKLSAVANDTWTFSSTRSPTLVFEDVQFSGT